MNRFDWRDPFIQLVVRSAASTIALVFVADYGVALLDPVLRRALFVPLGTSFFLGTLAYLAETSRKHFVQAVIISAALVALFPGAAWGLLVSLHIPYQSKEADFVALIPQALFAPGIFQWVRKRFEREDPKGEPEARNVEH
jgi:hypothetical protein